MRRDRSYLFCAADGAGTARLRATVRQPSESDARKLVTPPAMAMILLIADFPWAVSLREREPWSLAQQESNQPHQDCAFLHDGGRRVA